MSEVTVTVPSFTVILNKPTGVGQAQDCCYINGVQASYAFAMQVLDLLASAGVQPV
jgi:hypothetical protein